MRLKEDIKTFLSDYANQAFHDAKIYLFGSRVDDDKKGGDIDILILSKEKLTFSDLSKMRVSFYRKFGEQKIDIVNFTHEQNDPFKDIVLSDAVEL